MIDLKSYRKGYLVFGGSDSGWAIRFVMYSIEKVITPRGKAFASVYAWANKSDIGDFDMAEEYHYVPEGNVFDWV